MGIKFDDVLMYTGIGAVAYVINIFGFKDVVDGIIYSFKGKKITPCLTGYHRDTAGNCVPDTITPTGGIFSDYFPTNYTLNSGQTSPDGKWTCEYTGGGMTGTRTSSDGKRVMYEYPSVATSSGMTRSSLVYTTQDFTNFTLSLKMRTVRQLRTGSAPNNWEVGWILWSLTRRSDLGNRSVNHYYFIIKPQGCEFGKKDNIETNPALEEQIFLPLAGSTNLTIGQWRDVVITYKDFHTTVTVDGITIVNYQDNPNNPARMAHGSICLYNEDSEVEFSDVFVKAA